MGSRLGPWERQRQRNALIGSSRSPRSNSCPFGTRSGSTRATWTCSFGLFVVDVQVGRGQRGRGAQGAGSPTCRGGRAPCTSSAIMWSTSMTPTMRVRIRRLPRRTRSPGHQRVASRKDPVLGTTTKGSMASGALRGVASIGGTSSTRSIVQRTARGKCCPGGPSSMRACSPTCSRPGSAFGRASARTPRQARPCAVSANRGASSA